MNPFIFTFGDVWFSPYTVMIIFALFFCLIVGYIDALRTGLRQHGFDEWDLLLAVVSLVTGTIGARLLSAILNWDFYIQNPEYFYMPSFVGLSVHGAIIAGFITVFLWCRARKQNFFILIDYFAFYMGIGYGIVRIGCFLSGCCYGKVTDLPWGVVMQAIDNQPRHPVQLYASLGILIGVFIMLRLRRVSPFYGFIALSSVAYYGILRFTTEFFRDEEPYWMGLSEAQLVSLGLFVIAISVIYWRYSVIMANKRKGFL